MPTNTSEYSRAYYEKNKDRIREQNRLRASEAYRNDPHARDEYSAAYRKKNRDQFRKQGRETRKRLRYAALVAYSTDPPFCKCCGEDILEFLAIDHIENNGAEHRREIGTSTLYQWLKNNNYPEGFQVLCHNCNQAKGAYGSCPHEASNLIAALG